MYKERTLSGAINEASDNFKVVLLTGMRQTGKTTLLKYLDKKRKYITLDDPDTLHQAKTEPKLFFQQHRPPLLIDEVQYAPELFPYIKMIVDTVDTKGQIWLTGSQHFSLMKNVTESLAGRVALVDMMGFSLYERAKLGLQQLPYLPSETPPQNLEHKTTADTFRIIWKGSFPAMDAYKDNQWETFYKSYKKTYIERDVRHLINVGDDLKFDTFMRTMAAHTACELNLASIAKDVGISHPTTTRWLSVLLTSGLIYILPPWSVNIGKRLVKSPKIYFTDTGLVAYLTGWNTPETLEKGAMSGAFFETFVVCELLKSYIHNGREARFFYYRDSNKAEIDLLISENDILYPIEIKKTMHPNKNDISTFKTLGRKVNLGYGSIICMVEKPLLLTDDTIAISIWDI